MLTLTTRDAYLSGDYKGKTVTKEGEKVRTLDFGVENYELTATELNSFFGEPLAWNSLYNQTADGTVPFLRFIKALELSETIEEAYVELTIGIDRHAVRLANCTLSKIRLELREGGITFLSCRVAAIPFIEDVPLLITVLDSRQPVLLSFEQPGQQKELPLNTHGTGEQTQARH